MEPMLASLDHPDLRNPIMEHGSYNGGVLGRFISRDPIGFKGSSLNLYSYPVNPINAVDPSGLDIYLELVVVEGGTNHPYNPFGHSFLEVTPVPNTTSLWKERTTYGSTMGDNVTVNRELEADGAYQKGATTERFRIRLGKKSEKILLDHINERRKNEKWSEKNNCAVFSITAWNLVTFDQFQIDIGNIMEEANLQCGFSTRANMGIRYEHARTGAYPQFPSPRRLKHILRSFKKGRN